MGMTCMSTVGGSSGPVFGTLIVTLGKELPAAPQPADVARAARGRHRRIEPPGKVDVGEKTMLDVLIRCRRCCAEHDHAGPTTCARGSADAPTTCPPRAT